MFDYVLKKKRIFYHFASLIYFIITLSLFLASLHKTASQMLIFIPLVLAFLPILVTAIRDALRKKITTEVFLILATIMGIAAHQIQAITVVLLIMLIAKYVESFIEQRTGKAVESLIKLVPTTVAIQINNHEKMVDVHDIVPGMKVIIKTGQQIPVDGTIVSGQAAINESFLTGESVPKDKGDQEPVYAGTFVESGAIVILVQKVGGTTHFGKISKLLEQAETEKKAKIITISNKAAFIVVQALLVFIFVVWLFTKNLKLVATLLVFGSPIELTLVTPLAVLAGTAAAMRHGILVKGSVALEKFASVDTIIFDKTGTLTIGEPKVVRIESVSPAHSEHDILLYASILEKRSGHVLARAILNKADELHIDSPDPQSYESITGHGVIANYNNERFLLGSEHFTEAPEHGNLAIPKQLKQSKTGGAETYFYLSRGSEVLGKICLADTLRSDAKETITKLMKGGAKKIILLSGDRIEVAKHIAAKLGIDEVYGEIEPDKKLEIVRDLQKSGHKVAMVGDGINDAPALKQADVGIAMGAMGMEPAIEAADIVLMSNDLQGIVFIHALSRKIMRLIKQNIFLGFALIHALGICLAMLNLVQPIQAAVFHAVSDLLILANSSRLIRFVVR